MEKDVLNPSGILQLATEMDWLDLKIRHLLKQEQTSPLSMPAMDKDSAYGKFISEYDLNEADRVILMLAFSALFKPVVLLPFILSVNEPDKSIKFGGLYKKESVSFTPTLRTALYLLSGDDDELFSYYLSIYNRKHKLFANSVLKTNSEQDVNFADAELYFNEQFLPCILNGKPPILDGDAGFPARRSKRTHTLNDVILSEAAFKSLDKLKRFARNMQTLWNLPDRTKYRDNFLCIFSGDPGTGKSYTAEALGNELNLPVYKINFAQLVSKYIGETEKNLEKIFDRFTGHPGILFFDEAESIFSKRTEVKDSHDKHANNEQSYLLQKLEEFSGIIILATNVQNLAQYFDKAFQRRIRQIVTFEFPDHAERIKLWKTGLGASFIFEEGLVEKLAKNYQLTGGGIYNVISEGIMEALDKNTDTITFEILEPAMQEEFKKTGRRYEVCTDEMVKQDPVRRYGPGYEQRKNF